MNKYQKKNRVSFAEALICVFVSTCFAVSLQFFKGDILDSAVAGDVTKAVKYFILLVVFILCEVMFYFFYKLFSAKFIVGCTKHLKQDIFKSILSRSYVEYKEYQQGEFIAKYINEADTIKTRRFSMLPVFWEIVFKIVFVSIALFFLDWRIALITIILLTTPLYIPKLIEKRLQKAQTEHIKAVENSLAKITDWLSGFETIKNFSIEHRIMSKFEDVNNASMEKLLYDTQLGAVAQLITTLISYFSYFIILVCAAGLVLTRNFSAGDFFVAIGMIDQLSYPLISLAAIIRQLVAIKPVCASMEAFLIIPKTTHKVNELVSVNDKIQFCNVSFAYANQPPILHDFNFTICKNKKYLLKGPSGCGKTTIVNLLLRYYDVGVGSIQIDDEPINEFGSTYGCITVVRQDAILFHDTLRNNLTMYQDLPDDRLFDVLEGLGLHKFANIESINAIITENGANLSGGEKKRICLARALLRNTDVLILDEPLANLDEETAQRIEDLLLAIERKTMLVVSHQFSKDKLELFDSVVEFV